MLRKDAVVSVFLFEFMVLRKNCDLIKSAGGFVVSIEVELKFR